MKRIRIPTVIHKIFLIGIVTVCAVFGILLLFSVFRSGYGYQFDVDELHHVNLVYLYTHGYVPYRDVYNSFYTPLFELVITPAFLLFGFTFKTIAFTRYIMILLLAVRLVFLFLFVKAIFNKRTALLSLPLLLLDPFFVYSSMQIRGDNLMMTVMTAGLALLATGYTRHSVRLKYAGAVVLGLSLLIFIKVLPSLVITSLVIAYSEIRHKRLKELLIMACLSLVPFLLFMLWGVLAGVAGEMVRQIIIEAQASYNVFQFPVYFGAYNKPDNAWIYGTMGGPAPWVYVWMLPLLGAGGWFGVVKDLFVKKDKSPAIPFRVIMIIFLIIQYIMVFNVASVFLQHYLLLNWILVVFAAVLIDSLLDMLHANRILWYGIIIALCYWYISLARVSITLNNARGTINNPDLAIRFEKRWNQIPENEPVFPGFLFRPQVYPVPYGYYIGNVIPAVFNRLPPIPAVLEKNKLNRLILDEYTLLRLPQEAQDYINTHYTRVPGDEELMVRNP